MRQEAYRGLKFLHHLDIGYENLHKPFNCLPFSRAVLQLIFQRYPNYRLYSLCTTNTGLEKH